MLPNTEYYIESPLREQAFNVSQLSSQNLLL